MNPALANDGYCFCGCGEAVPVDPGQNTYRYYASPACALKGWTRRHGGARPVRSATEKDQQFTINNPLNIGVITMKTATATTTTPKAATTTSKPKGKAEVIFVGRPPADVVRQIERDAKKNGKVKAETQAPPAPTPATKPAPAAPAKPSKGKEAPAPAKAPQKASKETKEAPRKPAAKAKETPKPKKGEVPSKPPMTEKEVMKLKSGWKENMKATYIGRNPRWLNKTVKVLFQDKSGIGVTIEFPDGTKQSVSPRSLTK